VSPGKVIHAGAYLANVLWHQGRLTALLDLEWARPGPPDLEFEAVSKDDPDIHAQVSRGVLSLLMGRQGRRPRATHRTCMTCEPLSGSVLGERA